jgi:thioredoxin-related protein/outer membrane protein assembly factor BamD (BamD/ComL family)
MRNTLIGVVFVMVVSARPALAGETVQWRKDYNAARKEAAEKGKPLFLDFGTEECFHCRRLDQTTFKDSGIVDLLNDRFIPVKVDANREPALTQALKIQAYPTLIMAGSDGKILGVIEGYMEASRLNEHLQRAMAVATPDWMARDFNEASKAISANDYAKAITLLKSICEDGKDRPVQGKSKQLLNELEQQANQKRIQVKDLIDRGQSTQAMEQLTEVVRKFPGTKAAEDSSKQIASLTAKSTIREAARDQRANELLAMAKEEYRKEKFHRCVESCETILGTFSDSPEAREATLILRDIQANPDRLAKAAEELADQTAQMYTRLAEAWIQKGKIDEAALCYEKIMKLAPNTLQAQNASMKLAQMKRKTPTVPVQFQKP